MSMDAGRRTLRLEAIREIIETESVTSQAALATRLTDRGFTVTQSSVSRDLRSLPVGKVGGAYRITMQGASLMDGAVLRETLRDAITSIASAGPNLLVVHTVIGGASRVGTVIDNAGWSEIVGTVAGDDTLFLAVAGQGASDDVRRRLEVLMGAETNDG